MLIHSLYTNCPRAQSLRPVRVPSNQNTRWRLSFLLSLYTHMRVYNFAAMPYTCDIGRVSNALFASISDASLAICFSRKTQGWMAIKKNNLNILGPAPLGFFRRPRHTGPTWPSHAGLFYWFCFHFDP